MKAISVQRLSRLLCVLLLAHAMTARATTLINVTPAQDLRTIIESADNDTVINLSAGTFNLTRNAPFNQAILIENKTNLTIMGQGRDQTILNLPADAKFGFYTGSNVHDLTIENLHIRGTLPLATNTHAIGNFTGTTNVTDVRFSGLRVTNTAVGISADTGTSGTYDGVTITNNEILGTFGLDPGWGYGIEVTNPTNVLIADNLIQEATRHSIYIARAAPQSNVKVLGNTILNHDLQGAQRATTGRWYLAALVVSRASDVDVAFNRIINPRSIALSVEPDDILGWPTDDINLVGNEIIDAWYVGMWAVTNDTHTTLGNTITHFQNPDADGNGWGAEISFANFPVGVNTSSAFEPPNPRWSEVDLIAGLNEHVLVMQNGVLDRIVPYSTWAFDTSPTVWTNAASMTAMPEVGDDGLGRLHIVHGGTTYEVHPINWDSVILGNGPVSWTGNGSWTDDSNWSLLGVPGPESVVTINNNFTSSIALAIVEDHLMVGSISLLGSSGPMVLKVTEGAMLTVSGGMTVGPGAILKGEGAIVGDINVPGGIVAPGHNPGVLTMTGDYTQGAAATLEIELGGTVRGDEYDALVVSGDVTLAGTLDVLAIGGVVPMAGDLFDILDFSPANLTGSFSAVNLPVLASGLAWDQTNLYTSGNLLVSSASFDPCGLGGDAQCNTDDLDALYAVMGTSVPPTNSLFDLNIDNVINTADLDGWLNLAATVNGHSSPYLPGDTDLDRDVDLTDYNQLATNFDPVGFQGPHWWNHGNFDADNEVDLSDYNVLAANFSPAGYGAAAVPEPASVCLLLGGVLLSVCGRLSNSG